MLPGNFKRIVSAMGTANPNEGSCSLKNGSTIGLNTLQNGKQTMAFPEEYKNCSLALCDADSKHLVVSPWRYKKKAKEERRNFTETLQFSDSLSKLIKQEQLLKPILLDGSESDEFHVNEYKSKNFAGCWVVLVKDYETVKPSLVNLLKELKGENVYVDELSSVAQVLDCLSLGVGGVGAGACRALAEDGVAFNVTRSASGQFAHEELDMKDTELYKVDKGVLCEGCGCGACVDGLSKGYISHLTTTGELLGKISLMQHNLYQICKAASQVKA